MKSHRSRLLAAACVVLLLAGCEARSRTRVVKTTPIAKGPDTMEAARKALEGRWVLLSLNVTAEDGRGAVIDATGVLTSDAFGGMNVEYRFSDAGLKTLDSLGIKTPDAVISTTGRVVIDTQQRRITYVGDDFEKRVAGFDPDLDARRKNPFALERARYYTLGDDGVLTLATRYDNGKEAAVGRWKKAS